MSLFAPHPSTHDLRNNCTRHAEQALQHSHIPPPMIWIILHYPSDWIQSPPNRGSRVPTFGSLSSLILSAWLLIESNLTPLAGTSFLGHVNHHWASKIAAYNQVHHTSLDRCHSSLLITDLWALISAMLEHHDEIINGTTTEETDPRFITITKCFRKTPAMTWPDIKTPLIIILWTRPNKPWCIISRTRVTCPGDFFFYPHSLSSTG